MLTPYLIIGFVATCMISVLYWQVIQPVLLLSIRFRLFKRRDALRRLAIEQEERFDSFTYRELESMICKVVSVVPARSLLSFVWFVFRRYDPKGIDGIKRFHREASKRLNRYMEKTVVDALWILTLNSPLIAIMLAMLALFLYVIGRFKNFLFSRAENYIDELPMAA